jgi:tetratricopeptide (TPR) repeat protein
MSRAELAEAVNDHLWRITGRRYALDAHAIARYERGAIGRPSAPYRAALRDVLGVDSDAELGFHSVARGRAVIRGSTAAARSTKVVEQDGSSLSTELSSSADESAEAARTLWAADLARDGADSAGGVAEPDLSGVVLRWLTAEQVALPRRRRGSVLVGGDDVAAVHRACDMFEALDHEFGGGHARAAAVQYLHSEVAPLLQGRYTVTVGRALFCAAARFTYKTGAMAYDAGQHTMARHYFAQALNFAHWGADAALAGKALALMSHQANFLGHFRQALDLARSAQMGTQSRVSPGVQAMYAAMEARALASQGDERACSQALNRMERSFQARDAEQEPEWLGYFDDAEVHDEFAHCFHDLGRAKGARDHALASRNGARREFRRSRTFAGLILAGSFLLEEGGDVEEACRIAGGVVAEAGPMRSSRVKSYVRRFDERLHPFANATAVRTFRRQARASPVSDR